MRCISPHNLWLGNTTNLWDLRAVHEQGIVAIVDLAAKEKPPEITRDLTYLRMPLIDGGGNPPWLLQLAIDSVAQLLSARVATLVVCSAGMSRTPAITAAALSCYLGVSLASALKTVTDGHAHDVSPGLITDIQSVLAQTNSRQP